MSEVREQSNKEGRLWFLGVDAEEYTGELPEARSRLCVCRDSFLMTFVTSGISLAGSRQSSIAPNAVESREAPPNTTVSVFRADFYNIIKIKFSTFFFPLFN